jgi:uncharacterized membrane protein YcaP (DUF421 family)
LAFVVVLVLARFVGKKQVSQLTFFDYISGIFLGAVSAALANGLISVMAGLTNLILWGLLLAGYSWLMGAYVPARKIMDEQPTVLIQNGKILEQNLAKIQYSVPDLLAQLRVNGVFDPDQVEFALAETSGRVSVLKKSQHRPVTPRDLRLATGYEGLPIELVVNGQVLRQNLTRYSLSEAWLDKQLQSQGVTSIDDVVLATLATNGSVYVDKKIDSLLDKNSVQPL